MVTATAQAGSEGSVSVGGTTRYDRICEPGQRNRFQAWDKNISKHLELYLGPCTRGVSWREYPFAGDFRSLNIHDGEGLQTVGMCLGNHR